MWIPKPERGQGQGRLLMADLIDAAARLGIRRITVEADDVGRFAWACIGFVPDRAFLELPHTIRRPWPPRPFTERTEAASVPCLPGRPLEQQSVVNQKRPDGEPLPIAIGKAVLLETGARWYGEFDLEDPETMRIFNEYVGRK